MQTKVFKTPCQVLREKRDEAIFYEYENLMAVPAQSRTEVVSFLMKKYNLHSHATIYVIRKRVEERLKAGARKENS